jgi:glycerol-3-phosphate acyltransferase PlsY
MSYGLINGRATTWPDKAGSANWKQAVGIALSAYTLGCITLGYYLVRARSGEDIRAIGSGSVGASNVGRVLGRTGFCVTLLSDFFKGALAVWVARQFSADDRMPGLAMSCAVVGHIWPVQLRFQGGKGMATSQGALMIYDPRLSLTFGFLFLGGYKVHHRATLPSLLSLACLPIASWLFDKRPMKSAVLSLVAAFVIVAHRNNVAEELALLIEKPKNSSQ